MNIIHTTERTDEGGGKVYAALWQGQPIMADTPDRQQAEEHAEKTFQQAKGKTVLRHWDGDTAEDTFIKDHV